MVLSPSWPLDVGCKMLVSSCVFWIVPRSMLQVAFFWPCTLNGPHTSAVALSVVLALSPLSPGWAPWSWFILSCLGLPRDPVTSVLLKSCGMTPGFLRMLCVRGSHLTSHLLLTVEQSNPCCSLTEEQEALGDHVLYTCSCTTRNRAGSFGEQWVLLEGSAGILLHLPRLELLILTSPILATFHELLYNITCFA